MFNIHERRRVHLSKRGSRLDVHIDRQDGRASYFWLMFLSTAGFGEFCDTVWGAAVRHPGDAVYFIFPLFPLGLMCYLIVFAICVWGAFGTAEICVQAGSLVWTRKALNWTRVNP